MLRTPLLLTIALLALSPLAMALNPPETGEYGEIPYEPRPDPSAPTYSASIAGHTTNSPEAEARVAGSDGFDGRAYASASDRDAQASVDAAPGGRSETHIDVTTDRYNGGEAEAVLLGKELAKESIPGTSAVRAVLAAGLDIAEEKTDRWFERLDKMADFVAGLIDITD